MGHIESDGRQHNESDEHRRLKSKAVDFLVGLGFSRGEIREEVSYENGRIDIFASSGNRMVAIECEVETSRRNPLNVGATCAMDDGIPTFVMSGDSIYEPVRVHRKLEPSEYSATGDVVISPRIALEERDWL